MQKKYTALIVLLCFLIKTNSILASCGWEQLPEDLALSILRYTLDIPKPFLKNNYKDHSIPNPDCNDDQSVMLYFQKQEEKFNTLALTDYQILTHVYDWYSFNKKSATRYLLVNKQWQHFCKEIVKQYKTEHDILLLYSNCDLDALNVISFLCDKKIYGNDIHNNWKIQRKSSALCADDQQEFLKVAAAEISKNFPQTYHACYCSLKDNIQEDGRTALVQGLIIEKNASGYPIFFTLYSTCAINGFSNGSSIRNHNGQYTFEGFFKTITDWTKEKHLSSNYGTLSYCYMLLSYKAVIRLAQHVDQNRVLPNKLISENCTLQGQTEVINNNIPAEVAFMTYSPVTKLPLDFMIGVLEAADKIPYS